MLLRCSDLDNAPCLQWLLTGLGAKEPPIRYRLALRCALAGALQEAIMTKKRKSSHQSSGSIRDVEADVAQLCVCFSVLSAVTAVAEGVPRAAVEHGLHAGIYLLERS